MTQLEIHGLFHPDAHMFTQEYFYQVKPEVVIAIMLQFSFKSGLKEWRDKAHSASKINMNQMNIRNNFITMHRLDLTYEERQMVIESHILLKKKRDGKIKYGQ